MIEVRRNTERNNTGKRKWDKEVKEKLYQEDPRVVSETRSLTSSRCERVGTLSGSYRNQNRCGKRDKTYHYGQQIKKTCTYNDTRNGLRTVTGSEPRHKRASQELLPHMCSGSSTSCFLFFLSSCHLLVFLEQKSGEQQIFRSTAVGLLGTLVRKVVHFLVISSEIAETNAN